MYLLTIIIRLSWSFTLGLIFFFIGLILFLVLDILLPRSDRGYRVLNYMYKIGSLGWFKGLRMEKDEFDISVEKRRQGRE